MAEVIGVIAAIAGVVDVGNKISVSLIRYGYAVAIPNDAIKQIEPEVALLAAVLTQLESCLTDDVNLGLYNQETLIKTQKIAESCGAALNEMKDIIDKYFLSDKITIADRLRRYQKEKRVNLLRAEMDRLKSSIVLMLEVTQYARGIVGHQQSNKERDRVILLAMEDANNEATKRYNTLLAAIDRPGSNIVEDVLANLEPGGSKSGAKSLSYAMVDKSGAKLSDGVSDDDLAFKAAKITSLIDEIEATRKDMGSVIDHSGIWEKCDLPNGKQKYRNTVIRKPPKMSVTENNRSIIITPDQITPMVPIAHRVTDMYIALMGAVGSGKSTFINLCCDETPAQVSRGTEHRTESIEEYHFPYTQDIRVHLVDTPGFNDGHRSEREILTDLAEWKAKSLGPSARFSGIIYFHRIYDPGMKISAHRNLRLFEKLCGPDAFHSIILATTHWDLLGDPDTAVMHEQELHTRDEYWALMLRRGSSIVRHTGDKNSALRVVGTVGPLQHTKPAESLPDQQVGQWGRERGLSEAGLGLEKQSNEARINQLLAQYTIVLDAPPMLRRWSVDPVF